MKVSLVIPVYYNEGNLHPLYEDLKEKFINKIDYDYEIVMVNDGSGDNSWQVMQEIAAIDSHVKIYSLSRNFGSHAACLCGLSRSTGDCAIIKAADLQEPTELILDMVESWKQGNNVVLACREAREESKAQTGFANLYYWLVRKTSLPNMPKNGFDIYLLDRKVINVLDSLDEKNSAITGQILWSGFKTGIVYYTRKVREIGTSRWTLKKKIKLVSDTLFSFSTMPVRFVEVVGFASFVIGLIWAIFEIVAKVAGMIEVEGWTTLFIFNLVSFGIVMISLGILGEYVWRTFDASRNRPPYIVEKGDEKE
ncbi:dolichol-phosphate mannosyltransferase [Pseudobutyrivibrio sp. C4]|uniref:glycosyltransferase family 2 protein n=1 Tax=Pseudobutyrivibrio sp. C4 TaxID=1520803 RepID=UPI0008BCCB7D|nr:glycosyltransferase family 2 protein [Pseudobutyrivibrio sp. C4]SET25005.1 dolichol-phosphate mannosyltransferase [Pseudobutyrivibrio sp. C4]